MIWEDAELVQLSQFNTFMTSAPKLLLILYILITGESELGGIVIMLRLKLLPLLHLIPLLYSRFDDPYHYLHRYLGICDSFLREKNLFNQWNKTQ